ncbi:fungal hydrophobin [Trametes versicolor FP-101664 SS1]|uniref:fungal hydrophobin n=1 Tax=Trametes versicolor (strain FP-101664) TaxID=717944 RepID=UPI00046218B8|nr:fungal hydrophobin [Trametes versicolor FP-101664 SS1]EIW52222.1 fungal hydrophobin [Trametes versicolor FP-101664 SS1]
MFAKLTSAFAAFAILAVATATPQAAGSCSTGTLQCCNSVEAAGSAAVAPILAALGVVVQDLNIPVGLSCSGVNGVGVGGSDSCSTNAVCCDENNFGGLLAIGCLPASL